jgi:excisionase family DNA binding protein
VRLRLAIRGTRDGALRDELRQVEVALRRELGPAVPKRPAARLLGVSVTALDRWIDRGRLPVVAPGGGSRRLGVETQPLLELATRVRELRRRGRTRGLLAAAMNDLGWPESGRRRVIREDVARLPRPNVSLPELRRSFDETTPEQRVLEIAALHRSLNALAAGKRR